MTDEYARKYMGGDRIRFLDKVRMPRWAQAAIAVASLAGVAGAVSEGSIAPALAIVPVSLASWTLLNTIRVSVTDAFLHVQYGLWGPKVALDDLLAVEVIEYSAVRFGGWGIRFGLRGERAYSMPGSGGKAVQLRYRTSRGERVAVISSAQPDALKAAIDEARAARSQSLTDVRAQLDVRSAPQVVEHAVPQAHEHEERR
jgi:hypothetical protein